MKRTQALLGLGAGLISAVAAFGAVMPAGAANGVGGGPIAEQIVGSGSDTTQVVMETLDGLYSVSEGCSALPTHGQPVWYDFSCQAPDDPGTITTENYQHDQVSEAFFLGSGNGQQQLCNQGLPNVAHIDFARSSSAAPGKCKGLNFVAYARDAIVWEAFDSATSGVHAMNNPDPACAGLGACLTQQNLKDIFVNCTVTNWSQVGGQNVAIHIYTPQAGSGTRKSFESFLGGNSGLCPGTTVVLENNNGQIPPADRDFAISPFSFAVWTSEVHGIGGALIGKLDGIAPTTTTLANSSYPWGKFVYNVYCGTPGAGNCPVGVTTQTKKYIGEEGWICKPQAAHSVSPHYNANWWNLIGIKLNAKGFAQLPTGVIGGGDTNSDNCRLTTT